MQIIGLTGSIASGKSFIEKHLARHSFAIFDADKAVHKLLSKSGKAVNAVRALYPKAYSQGAINRHKLASSVFNNPQDLKNLEQILHPLVRREMYEAIKLAHRQRRKCIILNIPLLFENSLDKICDVVLLSFVNPKLQEQRYLKRGGRSVKELQNIINKQMSAKEKRKRADVIINTSLSKASVVRQLDLVTSRLQNKN
jgi:dephospho-CoA kinase